MSEFYIPQPNPEQRLDDMSFSQAVRLAMDTIPPPPFGRSRYLIPTNDTRLVRRYQEPPFEWVKAGPCVVRYLSEDDIRVLKTVVLDPQANLELLRAMEGLTFAELEMLESIENKKNQKILQNMEPQFTKSDEATLAALDPDPSV